MGTLLLLSTHSIPYSTKLLNVRLDFSKLLNRLLVKYPPIKGSTLKERSEEDFMKSIFNDAYAILFSDFLYKSICCGYPFELLQLKCQSR